MHFFKKDGKSYFFDNETSCFNLLPDSLMKELDHFSDEELTQILQPHLEKKEGVHCTDIDIDKCKRLVLIVNQKCNLGCTYCYAEGGSYGETHNFEMTEAAAKSAILGILSIFPKGIANIMFFRKYLSDKFVDIFSLRHSQPFIYNFINGSIEYHCI